MLVTTKVMMFGYNGRFLLQVFLMSVIVLQVVSILPSFYDDLFCMKALHFSVTTFYSCIFFHKDISKKKELLIKCWWTWIDFINILRAIFFYESALHSFSLATFSLCNFWLKNMGTKAARKMWMKLTHMTSVHSWHLLHYWTSSATESISGKENHEK